MSVTLVTAHPRETPARSNVVRPVLVLMPPSAGETEGPAADRTPEDLVLCQSSLAAVRIAAPASVAAGVREAVLAQLERRGLRAAVLTEAPAGAAPRAGGARWPHLSLAELGSVPGPLCDVLLVDGYDQLALSLPAIHVRDAKSGEPCAIYEVHAAGAPPRISVRCDGDLRRHARELVDWIIATAA